MFSGFTMVRQCWICKKLDFQNPDVTFHKFPKEVERRKKWLTIFGLENFFTVPKTADICSDHFDENDITFNLRKFPSLKSNAVPKVPMSYSFITYQSQEVFCKQRAVENADTILDNQCESTDIKIEEVDIKKEINWHESSSDSFYGNPLDIEVKVEGSDDIAVDEVQKINEDVVFEEEPPTIQPVIDDSCASMVHERVTEESEQFPSSPQLRNEIKRKVLNCLKCDYETHTKVQLMRHMGRRHKRKPGVLLKCNYCDYRTIYMGDLVNHCNQHTVLEKDACIKSEYGLLYKCHQCKYTTHDSRNLTDHFPSCNAVHQTFRKEIPRKNNNCHHPGSSLSLNKNKYEVVKCFKCKYCDYRTIYRWDFNNHCNQHTVVEKDNACIKSENGILYKCHKCEFTTHESRILTRHITRSHAAIMFTLH